MQNLATEPSSGQSAASSPRKTSMAAREKSPTRSWKGKQGQTVVDIAVDDTYYVIGYAAEEEIQDLSCSMATKMQRVIDLETEVRSAAVAPASPRWQIWSPGSTSDFRGDKFSITLSGVHLHPVSSLVLCSDQDVDRTHRWLVSCSVDRVVAWQIDELWRMAKSEMVENVDEDILRKWPAVSVRLFEAEVASTEASAQVAVRFMTLQEEAERHICVVVARGLQLLLYRVSSSLQSKCVVDMTVDISPRHLVITCPEHSELAEACDVRCDSAVNIWMVGGADEHLRVCSVVDDFAAETSAVRLAEHPLLPGIGVHCLTESAVSSNRCYVGGSHAIVQIFDASRPVGAGAVGKMHVGAGALGIGESANVASLCALLRDGDEMLVALLADGGVFVQGVLSVGGEPVLGGSASRIFRAGLPTPLIPDANVICALAVANAFAVFVAWTAPAKTTSGSPWACLAHASVLAAPPARSARSENANYATREAEEHPASLEFWRFAQVSFILDQ
jgi:hypothetical protein